MFVILISYEESNHATHDYLSWTWGTGLARPKGADGARFINRSGASCFVCLPLKDGAGGHSPSMIWRGSPEASDRVRMDLCSVIFGRWVEWSMESYILDLVISINHLCGQPKMTLLGNLICSYSVRASSDSKCWQEGEVRAFLNIFSNSSTWLRKMLI